jgi:diaminohydroxyphosphoribosylaminopyrimidine deaminase / 5-amino-6-(5-phosphoribosylamino)uracil reductase
MKRCLQLAEYAASYVAPNPMVGAVLVYDGKIIGEGYHQLYGKPHAEPNAIKSVADKSLLKQSTLYVNLEPCAHHGKTPPCANLIVASGIPKVVIGTLDPNPKVAGRGVDILRNASVEVKVGVLEQECRALNKRFFIFQEQKRPYIMLKWAQTHDGFMDKCRNNVSELPLQISNPLTRQITHKMRSENQSIMVSTNTVLLDNPSLTVRYWTGRSPVRVIVDRQCRIPQHYNVMNGVEPTIVFTQEQRPSSPNLEFVKVDFSDDCLKKIMHELYRRQIHSVLVEGGAKLLSSFIEADLWDEANIEVAPLRIGSGVAAPHLNHQPENRKNIEGHEWLFYSKLNY